MLESGLRSAVTRTRAKRARAKAEAWAKQYEYMCREPEERERRRDNIRVIGECTVQCALRAAQETK